VCFPTIVLLDYDGAVTFPVDAIVEHLLLMLSSDLLSCASFSSDVLLQSFDSYTCVQCTTALGRTFAVWEIYTCVLFFLFSWPCLLVLACVCLELLWNLDKVLLILSLQSGARCLPGPTYLLLVFAMLFAG
jgi:hypothetical protein